MGEFAFRYRGLRPRKIGPGIHEGAQQLPHAPRFEVVDGVQLRAELLELFNGAERHGRNAASLAADTVPARPRVGQHAGAMVKFEVRSSSCPRRRASSETRWDAGDLLGSLPRGNGDGPATIDQYHAVPIRVWPVFGML